MTLSSLVPLDDIIRILGLSLSNPSGEREWSSDVGDGAQRSATLVWRLTGDTGEIEGEISEKTGPGLVTPVRFTAYPSEDPEQGGNWTVEFSTQTGLQPIGPEPIEAAREALTVFASLTGQMNRIQTAA